MSAIAVYSGDDSLVGEMRAHFLKMHESVSKDRDEWVSSEGIGEMREIFGDRSPFFIIRESIEDDVLEAMFAMYGRPPTAEDKVMRIGEDKVMRIGAGEAVTANVPALEMTYNG